MWAKRVISGEEKGLLPGLMRTLLAGASLALYSPIMRVRNSLYDSGFFKTHRVSVPVICVGNITTGGTGKTPMVIWLCSMLREKGYKPVIVSRGYKSHGDEGNDEIRLMRQQLPNVPVVMNSDRVLASRKAIEQYQPDVIVLDDGFQHRRLYRDMNIVLIDSTVPFGYGYVLPRGLLREPLAGLNRADAIVLTRSDSASQEQLDMIKRRISNVLSKADKAQQVPIAASSHQPSALFTAENDESSQAPTELAGKNVFAFCGIGNPDSFIETLKNCNANVVGQYFLSDHAHYDDTICNAISAMANKAKADLLVTTEKDWVKIKEIQWPASKGQLHWLQIQLDVTRNKEQLIETVERVIASSKTKNS